VLYSALLRLVANFGWSRFIYRIAVLLARPSGGLAGLAGNIMRYYWTLFAAGIFEGRSGKAKVRATPKQ